LAANLLCACGQYKKTPSLKKVLAGLYESFEEEHDKPIDLKTKADWDAVEKATKNGRRDT
jgi:hypothetical protein